MTIFQENLTFCSSLQDRPDSCHSPCLQDQPVSCHSPCLQDQPVSCHSPCLQDRPVSCRSPCLKDQPVSCHSPCLQRPHRCTCVDTVPCHCDKWATPRAFPSTDACALSMSTLAEALPGCLTCAAWQVTVMRILRRHNHNASDASKGSRMGLSGNYD